MTYGSRANAAAATATACGGQGCPSCVKTGLPVLLVRPGLADAAYANARRKYVEPLLKGVADQKLTASGYVMRTLRKGYLHAYYEHPHTPELKQQGGWQLFHVDEGGYLTPVALAAAGEDPKAFYCKRTEAYAIAMLFVIPDAANTQRVWVGFSDHPWSEPVRKRYAANESLRSKRMACIDAKAGRAERSLPMSVLNIEECVADYKPKLAQTHPEALRGNPFQGHQLTEEQPQTKDDKQKKKAQPHILDDEPPKKRREWASHLMAEARKLVAADPSKKFTDANLMIVSVPDPVGVTTEAAQRRLTLCNDAARLLEKKGPDCLPSALQIEGMLKIIEQNGADRRKTNAGFAHLQGKAVTRKQFDTMMASKQLPADARFRPGLVKGSPNPNHWYPDNLNGTIDIPSAKEIDYQTNDLVGDVLDKLQGGRKAPKHREFLQTYYQTVADDEKQLARVEEDYLAWLRSDARKFVTKNDFDTANETDGLFYARCICKLTLGGPLTKKGQEAFEGFLTLPAANDEALLWKALLGNQMTFAKWVDDPNQWSKGFDAIKTLADLSPGRKFAALMQETVQDLLPVVGAVSAGLDRARNLPEQLRYKLKLATMALMIKSEPSHITLVRVRVTLSEATALWHSMKGEIRQAVAATAKSAERKVESLVLNGATALEMNGAPVAAMGMVDVYLIAKGAPEDVFRGAKEAGAAVGKYVVRPAEVYGNKLAQWTMSLDFSGLTKVARDYMAALRTKTGVLATGSGVLQVLVVAKTWGDYSKGNSSERQDGALALLSAGLGIGAVFAEIGVAKRIRLHVATEGLTKLAGMLGAFTTAIDAVQAYINMERAGKDGDGDARAGYRFQLVLFGVASGALVAAAFGWTTPFLGLSATGWGLLLVALGVIVGFVILLIKDRPPEKWAAKTLWGKASDKWGGFEKESVEANKTLLGLEVDFSYRLNLLENMAISAASSQLGFGGLSTPQHAAQSFSREAWLRLKIPLPLDHKLPWEVRIYGSGKTGDSLVAGIRHYGEGRHGWLTTGAKSGVQAPKHEPTVDKDSGYSSHIISVKVDMLVYDSAYARVSIFAPNAGAAGDEVFIVDEVLRD